MYNIERAIRTLEYDMIINMLADCAPTEGAKMTALSLMPTNNYSVVLSRQRRTADAKRLMDIKGMPSFGGVIDISASVERAEKGAVLTNAELLSCANVLRTARRLAGYISEDTFETSLDELFNLLTPNRYLEERIYRTVLSEDMIADEASPELANIRRKIRITNSRIREILQKYTSGEYSKILQENIVTQRAGRYVVPVKIEHKNEINGLIHDTSASGATVFIEPMAVVEANNELRLLESREAHEIERILVELSANVASAANTLRSNYRIITELAFAFTCAELSYRMRASQPKITEKRELSLVKARHPLLDKDTCVPISVSLGEEFDTLIITGPNTGGKTVALKTIGLFALMAQAGLQIPAHSDSTICVFDEILADIGDEQSIEMSLSTFSSSMSNIVDIISGAGERSLVLLDELCAGTDPVEGAALAIAIIEELRSRRSLTAVTTHYAEIKAYALNTPGVCNAACEFDVESLRPTYRLIMGAPGKSNAFAISTRLGLLDRIVERARELMGGTGRDFEEVIAKLDAARVEMERERDEARRLREEYERFKESAEEKLRERLANSKKEEERAIKRARKLIISARASSDYIMAQLEKVKKERDSENLGRALAEARKAIRERLKADESLLEEPDPYEDEGSLGDMPQRELREGDEVIIVGTSVRAVVIDPPDKSGNVTVKSGGITTRTKVSKLRLAPSSAASKEKDKQIGKSKTAPTVEYKRGTLNFKPELDIRGYTAEDGWFAVDSYLDEAILAGVRTVRIIHGKGTGALRNALHNFMKSDSRISSFRLGAYGEGDTGVTIVELK